MVVPVVNCMISVRNKKRAALSRAVSDKRMSEVNYTFDLLYTVHKAVLYVFNVSYQETPDMTRYSRKILIKFWIIPGGILT